MSVDNFEHFDQYIRYTNSINGIWRFPAKAALALGVLHTAVFRHVLVLRFKHLRDQSNRSCFLLLNTLIIQA